MNASRSTLVERWAADQGYELICSEYRMLFQGPFSGKAASKMQPVYFVQVRDTAGTLHSGWLRFRRRFWGMGWDTTEVRWEA